LLVASQPRHKVSRAIERLARDVAASFGWTPAVQQARSQTGSPRRFSLPSLSLGRPAPGASGLGSLLRRGSENAVA
jgi:hypothetical protein